MKINISNIGNKEWLDFKADISFGLYYALKELGHDLTMTINQLVADRLNIIIGADFLAANNENVNHIANKKFEYIIYEVERFDDFYVNKRLGFNSEAYKKITESAKFIVTPYLYNLNSYSKYFDNEKIRYSRWGFHESMVNEGISRFEKFEFQALFFGLLKGSRLEKIRKLESNKKLKIKIFGRDEPLLFKNYFISSSKWGLNLSYGDAEKFTNPFRLYSMASNGMPILSDAGIDEDNYLSLCKKIDMSDFEEFLLKDVETPSSIIESTREKRLIDGLKEIF